MLKNSSPRQTNGLLAGDTRSQLVKLVLSALVFVMISDHAAANGNIQNLSSPMYMPGAPGMTMSTPVIPSVTPGPATMSGLQQALLACTLAAPTLMNLASIGASGNDLERATNSPYERDHETLGKDAPADLVKTFDCKPVDGKMPKITSGFNQDEKCTEDKMHAGMKKHMDEHFLGCVQKSADAAGLPKPESIHINHMGCYNERNKRGSGQRSLHSLGRALDIGAIIFKPSGTKMKMHVNQSNDPKNLQFYSELRKCWANTLPASCRTGRAEEGFGSVGHWRSGRPADSNHSDHLHLAYPPCAGE